MSVVSECARVEQAVRRARSLVAGDCPPQVSTPRDDVRKAAGLTTASARTAADMSGVLVDRHQLFATKNAASLSAAGDSDTAFQSHMVNATALARTGAQRLDVVVAQTRETSRAAATVTSPEAERMILTALRRHVTQTADVVDSIRQQGAELATHINSLRYEMPAAPSPPGPILPAGPIVWCLRPNGTFGRYRCSILYPDLRVGTYWSTTDDTHG